MPEEIILAARNLRKRRKETGLTQKEVGRLPELETETVCRMENGHNPVSLRRLQQFADLYGCTGLDLPQPPFVPYSCIASTFVSLAGSHPLLKLKTKHAFSQGKSVLRFQTGRAIAPQPESKVPKNPQADISLEGHRHFSPGIVPAAQGRAGKTIYDPPPHCHRPPCSSSAPSRQRTARMAAQMPSRRQPVFRGLYRARISFRRCSVYLRRQKRTGKSTSTGRARA